MAAPRAQFRVPDSVLRRCESNSSDAEATRVVQRDLERYYTLLQRSLPRFSEGESLVIANALDGVRMGADTAHLLWAQVKEVMEREALHERWEVHPEPLIERLRGFTLTECLAVIDAVERFDQIPPASDWTLKERLQLADLVLGKPWD